MITSTPGELRAADRISDLSFVQCSDRRTRQIAAIIHCEMAEERQELVEALCEAERTISQHSSNCDCGMAASLASVRAALAPHGGKT